MNGVKNNKIIDYTLWISVIFSISIIMVILGEFINRKNLIDLYTWIIDFKIQFGLNVIIVVLLITNIGILFKNIGWGTLFSGGLYIILCIVNYYKNLLKGEYLNVYDFKLVAEGLNIVKEFNIKLESNIMISGMIFLGIAILVLNLNFKY